MTLELGAATAFSAIGQSKSKQFQFGQEFFRNEWEKSSRRNAHMLLIELNRFV